HAAIADVTVGRGGVLRVGRGGRETRPYRPPPALFAGRRRKTPGTTTPSPAMATFALKHIL
ncbi:MAG: hypothetical protein ABR572_13385, partial [Cryomorphaceae bacterium]